MKQNMESEVDPHIYRQLIFYKGSKAIQWRKKIDLLTNSSGAIIYIYELQCIPYTTYKIEFKIDCRTIYKTSTCKTDENIR